MNSINRLKNLLGVLLLLSSGFRVHGGNIITTPVTVSDMRRRITGRSFLQITTGKANSE